nr:MAG TPA: Chitin synthase 1 [Caudoviricetes sp.]
MFSYPDVADYLDENKETLLKGRAEELTPDWYLYGRTQAIKDVYRKKYSINFLVRNIESIRLNQVPAGAGVYSGLYIVTDVPFEVIERAIKSEEFINYISALKHYKSGGYYNYSSKELEQYLNYKISQYKNNVL